MHRQRQQPAITSPSSEPAQRQFKTGCRRSGQTVELQLSLKPATRRPGSRSAALVRNQSDVGAQACTMKQVGARNQPTAASAGPPTGTPDPERPDSFSTSTPQSGRSIYVGHPTLVSQYILRPWSQWIGAVLGDPLPRLPGIDDRLWQLLGAMFSMGGLRTFERVKGVAM